MANYNRVILIGRFTRDPELKTIPQSCMVCTFGFCVNRYRKDTKTGQQTEEPMFIECKCYGREPGKGLAHDVRQYCRKGHLAQIDGAIELERWQDKATGASRQRHVIYVQSIQFLTPKTTNDSVGQSQDGSVEPDDAELSNNIPF